MPRRNRGKKKHQSQQEQQIPQARQNDGGGGEELYHEVKHEAAASIVRSAVQPAIEYKYGSDDINLLTQALDGANHAMHYLSKKELMHHSHIIELIQALQDTSNSLYKIIPIRIDEELKRHIAWEQRKGSKHTYYIADRLVAAHAGSIRSLLSSMQYELGYLHEWCGEFRELAIHRIIWGRFKEIESTVPIKKQAKAKAECMSALTSVPKIVDGEMFGLPLHDPQSCFEDQFGSTLANIWEALTIIKHISLNVPQQPLTQSKIGAIASAIMVAVENLKKLPRDHALRNDRSTFLALKELRNELAHSAEIKSFTRRPDNLFSQYIEPFLMFRDHVVEPIINNMPRIVSANRDRTVEESVQEEDGAVLQDVDASYRKAHGELFDKLLQIGYIIKLGVNPVYQANGRIFSDEELVKIFIRLIILDKELLVQILEESRRYTTLSRKSLLNMPILYHHCDSQHKDGKLVFQYRDEENKYLTRLTLIEPTLMHANINCPNYRNVYVLELVVKQAQWAIGANNNVEISLIRTLLELGANPNVETFFPFFNDVINPLIVCASAVHNRGGLLKLLLEHGANANLENAKLFLRYTSSASSSKETDDFIRLLLKYGVDPLNEFETNAGCTHNIIGRLASDDNISDEKACDTLLAIIRAIIPMYGMTAVQALLRSPFTDTRWNYNEKYLFVDVLNRGIFYNKDGFKKLVNLLMQLSSQDNDLVHAVVSNDLKTIRRFLTVNHGSAVQALMNMRLYSIKSTKELRSSTAKLNKKQQDKLVEAESSKLNKQLEQGFKQELILVNYHKHHKGPFNIAEQLTVIVVQHELEEVGFNDFVKLFCDANVAEQVIAWSKHGIGNLEAPTLEVKDDGMAVPQASSKMIPAQAEAKATKLIDAHIVEAIARMGNDISSAALAQTSVATPRLKATLESVSDESSAPFAATKVVSIEESAAAEVASILKAAAHIIVASGTSTAAHDGAGAASVAPLRLMSPTQAPTPSPTVISSEVLEMTRLDESTLAKLRQDYEDELPNSESVPTPDPYIPMMMGLDKAHQTVRIVGSLLDTRKMINDPNVNTVTRAAMGYGHIVEIVLEKNLGMKYITVAVVTCQYFQGDSWGAIKSAMMLAGRTLPAALMPIAPVPALVIKGLFICYDAYGVAQDLKELIGSQTQMSDESWEL